MACKWCKLDPPPNMEDHYSPAECRAAIYGYAAGMVTQITIIRRHKVKHRGKEKKTTLKARR